MSSGPLLFIFLLAIANVYCDDADQTNSGEERSASKASEKLLLQLFPTPSLGGEGSIFPSPPLNGANQLAANRSPFSSPPFSSYPGAAPGASFPGAGGGGFGNSLGVGGGGGFNPLGASSWGRPPQQQYGQQQYGQPQFGAPTGPAGFGGSQPGGQPNYASPYGNLGGSGFGFGGGAGGGSFARPSFSAVPQAYGPQSGYYTNYNIPSAYQGFGGGPNGNYAQRMGLFT